MSFRTIEVRLTASIAQYQAQLGAAAAQTRSFGQDVVKAAGEGNKAMEALGKGLLVAGGLIAGGLAISVTKAMEFEREMRNVNSITKQSEAAFAATSQQVLALSRTVPQSASTLAKGLYDIASSGFAGAEGMEILEASAIAATAGMTTTDVSAQAITATLNAYGRQARDAGDVSDVLFKTVEVGVITFEELASGMGDWVGMAAAAKVPVDEAAAAIAAMTLTGISAAEAGTSLNRVLESIISPSDALANELAELGYQSGAQALETDGLRGVMEKLRASTGGNITELQALFPEVRALRGVLGLTAAEGRNFGNTFDQITDAQKRAGAAQAAYNEQSKALGVQWELTKSSMGAFAIEVGNRLLPALTSAAQLVGGLFDSFSGLPGPVITATTALAGITAVALTVGGALLVLAPRVVATKAALLEMGPAGVKAADGLGRMFTLLGRAAALIGFTVLLKEAAEGVQNLYTVRADSSKLVADLEHLATTGEVTGEALRVFGTDLDGLAQGVEDIGNRGWSDKFLEALNVMDTGSEAGRKRLQELDAALGEMAYGGNADGAAAAFDRVTEKLLAQGLTVEQVRAAFPEYIAAQERAKAESEAVAVASEAEKEKIAQLGAQIGETTLKTDEQTEAQKLLQKVYDDVATSIQGFTSPMGAYNTALETNKAKAEEWANAQNEGLEKTKVSWEDYPGRISDSTGRSEEAMRANKEEAEAWAEAQNESVDDAKVSWEDYAEGVIPSLGQVLEELNKQEEAFNNWADNLAKIVARGRGDLAIELAKLGPEAAPLVQSFADETGGIFNEAADAWIRNTRRGQDGSAEAIVQGALVQQEFARQGANATVETVAAALGLLPPEVQRIVDDSNQRLRDGEPAWNQSWGYRTTISLEEMQRVANEAPPEVQRATNDINQYLIDTNPEFARQFALRRGVSIDEMNRVLTDAPPHILDAARLLNQHLNDTKPEFDLNWGNRKTISIDEMQTLLNDAPPRLLQATNDINRYLRETNPEFAAQFALRRGVSVEEMNRLLAEAPPPVLASAQEINRYLNDNLPAFNQSFVNRSDAAAREMAGMRGRVPPIVGGTADDMTGALNNRHPAFGGAVNRYALTLEGGVRTVSGALSPFLANRGFGPITAAEGAVIDYYAAGGMKEKHVAQIAQAGSWRVWAEPETGGEAYIPLAVAKRERSTAILEEVASRFGLVMRPADEDDVIDYHKGGICGHQGCQHFHSGGLYVPPPHPQFADFGPPMRPAGSGTTHNMQQAAAEWARRHMQEPHHTAPPPPPGGGGPVAGGGPVSGGKALGRVQSVLGEFPGARITSTYRSPSQNAAAGGARNSYHMDRNNPAVDIGGPTATLDRLAGRLRGMGGWREGPLWRVRGHFDHVHVADEGLIINSMQSFDKGGWLQPGMTLAHNGTGQPERVIAMRDGGLMGDTFYGDPGGFRRREDRFDDEEGAQFDYAKNRNERRFYAHERLDPPLQRPKKRDRDDNGDRDKVALDRLMNGYVPPDRAGGSAPIMAVPVNQSNDNSVTFSIGAGAVKVDVRAEVGADPSALQARIVSAVNESMSAWSHSLRTEIRARRR